MIWMTRVRIYADEDYMQHEMYFIDAMKAEEFVHGIKNDDGLQGISRVEVKHIAFDDESTIDGFWAEMALSL